MTELTKHDNLKTLPPHTKTNRHYHFTPTQTNTTTSHQHNKTRPLQFNTTKHDSITLQHNPQSNTLPHSQTPTQDCDALKHSETSTSLHSNTSKIENTSVPPFSNIAFLRHNNITQHYARTTTHQHPPSRQQQRHAQATTPPHVSCTINHHITTITRKPPHSHTPCTKHKHQLLMLSIITKDLLGQHYQAVCINA